MVNPVDIEITGWDISDLNMFESCKRAQVLETDLVNKLKDHLSSIVPMPAAFNPDYIAANQSDRVNSTMKGTNIEVIA